MRVLVIGAGLMGSQIGCEYAIGGHPVAFAAPHPDAARKRIEDALELAERHELVTSKVAAAARANITVAARPDLACDLVVESVPEDLELKVEVLRPVKECSPDAIFATNTSSLSISALGEALGLPERVVGTHYWNPPLLMPLVEVVAGDRTAPALAETVAHTLVALGKRPVFVARDVPGFVWNRLQLALVREALWIVENGVASPSAVDEIVRDGLARRWRHVGPFQAAALGGIATWLRIGQNLLPTLSTASSLDGLERWIEPDDASMDAARKRRDAALTKELLKEQVEQASKQLTRYGAPAGAVSSGEDREA